MKDRGQEAGLDGPRERPSWSAVLDPDTFDRLLGVVLTVADEVYFTLLRRGFAGYVDVEQRWRARLGLPPNPVSPI